MQGYLDSKVQFHQKDRFHPNCLLEWSKKITPKLFFLWRTQRTSNDSSFDNCLKKSCIFFRKTVPENGWFRGLEQKLDFRHQTGDFWVCWLMFWICAFKNFYFLVHVPFWKSCSQLNAVYSAFSMNWGVSDVNCDSSFCHSQAKKLFFIQSITVQLLTSNYTWKCFT